MLKQEGKEFFTKSTVVKKEAFSNDAGYIKSSQVVNSWPAWKKEIVGSVTKKAD